jgi:2,4-dienoyl-CoA reductase-like NADH-dependent reductase (Old Yellow Enzyme family)
VSYPHLFSPLRLGPLELRNRIVLSAMTTGFGFVRGAPTDDMIAYVRARSSGVGLATIAFGAVRPEGRVEDGIPWMWRDDAGAVMVPLADAIHECGALASLQLGHAGRQVSPRVIGGTPVAPSAVAPDVHVDVPPRELTGDEVAEIVAAFAAAAAKADAAGFDAIEVHAAHGYLIQQFLSPASNRRSDRYGADPALFGVEVIEAVRRAAPQLAVLVRINGSDVSAGGLTIADGVAAAGRFTEAGAHGVVVSAGVYGSVPYTIPLLDDAEGTFLPLAARIRAETGATVFGVGRITTPATAEEAIVRGDVDGVAIGRALLADPDWVAKAEAGSVSDIRPCIATVQGCAGMLQYGNPISCAVNPEVGRERRPRPEATMRPQRILVVGGGPAGMEAARRAAELGHHVTLFEREGRLGGQLRWAAATPPLAHLSRLVAWYERQLALLGVDVRLGVEGDQTAVAAAGADAVVIATGAATDVPALAGYDLLPTWTLEGALSGGSSTTGTTALPASVVVAGSGQRALAGALWAAQTGADVTLLHDGRPGSDTSGLARRAFLARCEQIGIRLVPGRIAEVLSGGVAASSGEIIPSHAVVLAGRLRPQTPPGVAGVRIGDVREPRDVAAAIAEGRQAAEALDQSTRT